MQIKHLGEICVGPTLSAEEIRKVNFALKKDKLLGQRVKIHKQLAGETRYKIIKLLVDLKELCVCDLAEILNISISSVSHQLKMLREAKVVTTRREGQTIYYSLKSKEIKKLL